MARNRAAMVNGIFLNQEKYCIYGLCPGAFCDQSICYIFSRVVQNDKLRWELGRKTDGQKRIMGKVYKSFSRHAQLWQEWFQRYNLDPKLNDHEVWLNSRNLRQSYLSAIFGLPGYIVATRGATILALSANLATICSLFFVNFYSAKHKRLIIRVGGGLIIFGKNSHFRCTRSLPVSIQLG